MARKFFDCEECGTHGKIVFKEKNELSSKDIAFCPACGADINEEYDDDEDFDYEENGIF